MFTPDRVEFDWFADHFPVSPDAAGSPPASRCPCASLPQSISTSRPSPPANAARSESSSRRLWVAAPTHYAPTLVPPIPPSRADRPCPRPSPAAAARDDFPPRGWMDRFLPNPKLKLREQLGELCRFRHYSHRTENVYWHWITGFIQFHRRRATTSGGNLTPLPAAPTGNAETVIWFGEKAAGFAESGTGFWKH